MTTSEPDGPAATAAGEANPQTAPGTGLERIAAAFAGHGRRGALMPYLMGGYPDVETSVRIAQAYIDGGADLIEFGLPFSDPLADGPVIHAAATEALRAGVKIGDVLDALAPIAAQVPVMVMTYFNIVEARGADVFLDRVVDLGVCGLIVPDVPMEEGADLLAACDARGLALVPFVAPTTSDERMRAICAEARGFIYTVSVTGTTGERSATAEGLSDLVARVKRCTDVPVAVGFGISGADQASSVAEIADGAIVGTRLVREVAERLESGEDPVPAAEAVVRELSDAMR